MKFKARHIAIVAAGLLAASGVGYTAFQGVPASQTSVVSSLPQLGRVGVAEMYADPAKTPGTLNPAITQDTIGQTICNRGAWSTKSVRDTQSTPSQKNKAYDAYGIPHPKNNVGKNQQCELDHLISLELGGGDGMDNIWAECGPAGVSLNERYFKMKDKVENYLHDQVCSSGMTLKDAQSAIVNDWYRVYLKISNQDTGYSDSDD